MHHTEDTIKTYPHTSYWYSAKDIAINILNTLAPQIYVLSWQKFSSLVSQAVVGTTQTSTTNVYQ